MSEIIEQFLEANIAGLPVMPESVESVIADLENHVDVILVVETAQDFFLLNKNFIDIKVKGGV